MLFFDKGIRNIPGLQSMKLHATYLAWVSFKNLGISEKEIVKRIHKDARIVASIGSSFGTGGEGFMRFNLACPRSKIYEALSRLSLVFNDIQ